MSPRGVKAASRISLSLSPLLVALVLVVLTLEALFMGAWARLVLFIVALVAVA